MKRALALALGLAIAGCATGGDLPAGQKIVVQESTWQSFQDYLGKVNSTYRGVFAMDTDGHSWGWSLCPAFRCWGGRSMASEALDGCRKSSGGTPCVIFARDHDIIVPYEAPSGS
jgi:hypothetical protein